MFIRSRQTFGGFSTFDKGLSAMTISSAFHRHLTFYRMPSNVQRASPEVQELQTSTNQGSMAPSLLHTGLWPPEANQPL